MSLADVLTALLRHRRLVVGLPGVLGVATLVFFLLFGSYVAESSFTPQTSGLSLSTLAGLAAQFGVNVPGGLGGETASIDFYADVLQSPELLAQVAQSQYRFATRPGGLDTLRGTLLDLYNVRGDTPEERVRKAVKKLEGRVSISTDRLANIIVIKAKAPWRELAQRINRRMLDVLNQFNLEKLQLQAAAERRFVEGRLAQAQAELAGAEDSMQRFLETNRTYQSSPRLAFQATRLQRRIELHQQVYTTLAQSYEQARIEEVRNTPVITIIERPELFSKRSRSPVVMGLLAVIGGLALAVAIAMFLEYVAQERRDHPESFRELENSVGRFLPGRRRHSLP